MECLFKLFFLSRPIQQYEDYEPFRGWKLCDQINKTTIDDENKTIYHREQDMRKRTSKNWGVKLEAP